PKLECLSEEPVRHTFSMETQKPDLFATWMSTERHIPLIRSTKDDLDTLKLVIRLSVPSRTRTTRSMFQLCLEAKRSLTRITMLLRSREMGSGHTTHGSKAYLI
ncbi:hypothetical protein EC991_009789, partial [Linnemannia zychae]